MLVILRYKVLSLTSLVARTVKNLSYKAGDPFHLYETEAISGTEDKRSSIMTKDALTAQEILKRMKTKTRKTGFSKGD